MTVLKKVFLVTIMVICGSFSFCYAIDENQLSSGTPQQPTNSYSQTTIGENIQIPDTNTQTENNIENTVNENTLPEEAQNQSIIDTSTGTSISEPQTSTTVSNVSSESKTSTFTNILNIALLVVGVLLVFLAIAILIKLNS